MGGVIWSPSAMADAESIAAYISRDSADRAALFVDRLFDAAERVAGNPEAGRMIPEFNMPRRREVFIGVYRLMYLIEGSDVWITAVVHGARDWSPPSP